jgi:hypothetical protein
MNNEEICPICKQQAKKTYLNGLTTHVSAVDNDGIIYFVECNECGSYSITVAGEIYLTQIILDSYKISCIKEYISKKAQERKDYVSLKAPLIKQIIAECSRKDESQKNSGKIGFLG